VAASYILTSSGGSAVSSPAGFVSRGGASATRGFSRFFKCSMFTVAFRAV